MIVFESTYETEAAVQEVLGMGMKEGFTSQLYRLDRLLVKREKESVKDAEAQSYSMYALFSRCGKYTMEEAKENGDIIVQNDVTNSDRFESFLKKSSKANQIRFASRRLRLKATRCCMTSSMMASRITIRLIHRVINSVQQTMIVKTKSVRTRQDKREGTVVYTLRQCAEGRIMSSYDCQNNNQKGSCPVESISGHDPFYSISRRRKASRQLEKRSINNVSEGA